MDCISKLNLLNYLLLTSSKYACRKKRKKLKGPKRPERRNHMIKVSKTFERAKEAIIKIVTLNAFLGKRIDADSINNEFERLYNSQERRLDATLRLLQRIVETNTDIVINDIIGKEDRDNG